MRLAWRIEARWTKREILEAYLNLVSFRGELEGVAAAASALFSKAPHGLTEAEAAVLAALLRSPNAGLEAVGRRARALREALAGEESREAVTRALDAPVGFGPSVTMAPHAAARLLTAAPGFQPPSSPMRTTLDAALQRYATESLRRHLLALRSEHVQDAAVLVVDNASGRSWLCWRYR
jgi:penicillin-binding protein 1C